MSKGRRFLLCGLLLGLLAGTQVASAATTIRFFAQPRSSGDGSDVNEQLVKLFNSKQNAFRVEYIPATGDWVNKVTVEMAAGSAADVIAGWQDFFRAWLEQGQALPLDKFLSADLLRDFVPSHLRLFQVNGQQMALPHYTGVSGIFYNVDMFNAAGLEAPDEKWTWDTLLAAAKKLTRRDGSGKVTQWGFDVHPSIDRFVQFVWENGGRAIEEGQVVGDRLYFDEPKAVEAFQFQHSLIWEHQVAAPYSVIGKWPHDMFWNGIDLAMWQTGSWDVSITMQHAKAEWNVAVRPRGRTGIPSAVHTADGYLVYKGTKHPNEAVEFLKFLVSPEAQRLQMVQANLQPARLSLGGAYARDTAAAKKGLNMKVFIEQTAYARPSPLFTKQNEVNPLFWPYFERIFYKNELPVRTGIEELTDRVNAILAK